MLLKGKQRKCIHMGIFAEMLSMHILQKVERHVERQRQYNHESASRHTTLGTRFSEDKMGTDRYNQNHWQHCLTQNLTDLIDSRCGLEAEWRQHSNRPSWGRSILLSLLNPTKILNKTNGLKDDACASRTVKCVHISILL